MRVHLAHLPLAILALAPASAAERDLASARQHWSFRPLREVQLPAVRDESWVRSPIDRFILAALEKKALTPAPPTGPRKLIRRVALGAAGLPPTPAEVEAFVKASEDDPDVALRTLVDRLLASRHHGERSGRHWLDVVRYADSDGQEADRDRPGAYHYRDFVIRALNDDMPFDRFVRWQLAGDEYEPDNLAAVAATGFLVAGTNTVLKDSFLEEERLRNRYNELDDMVSTIGTAFLGLTIGCARCHDHKYDALSAREYYRLLAAVHSGDRAEVNVGKTQKVLAFRDKSAQPATTWLFERADFNDRDEPVELGFPAVLLRGKTESEYLAAATRETPKRKSTFQRRALAEWMTDVEHGAGALLARVIVNRIWQQHFGVGLSRTSNDFGVRSEKPSHPHLLDWLAQDLVRGGWKLKRLHRMILTSATYRQAAMFDAAKARVDPANRLLGRMRPRRLEAEILRDAMLAVGGTLNLAPYGPGFKPPIAKEAMLARNLQGEKYPAKANDEPATRRRSVYMFHKRLIPFPLLAAFDRPDSLQSCGRRTNTTVAPQALAILNDGFVRLRAFDFAERLLKETGVDDHRLVERAFELAFARPPSDRERQASVAFIVEASKRRTSRKARPEDARRSAVADFCQSILGLNEFLYVD